MDMLLRESLSAGDICIKIHICIGVETTCHVRFEKYNLESQKFETIIKKLFVYVIYSVLDNTLPEIAHIYNILAVVKGSNK